MIRNLIPTPYQLMALTKLKLSGLNGILITDGVGVGKTISAGYIISYYSKTFDRPTYILSPMNLVDKWMLELQNKFGLQSTAVRNMQDLAITVEESNYHDYKKSPKIYVVSNTFLRREYDNLELKPGLLVVDEIHNFRNKTTHGFQNLRKICEDSIIRVGLTATPLHNSFDDIISIFEFLLPHFDRYSLKAFLEEMWSSKNFDVLSPMVTRFEKENLGIHFAKRDIVLHRAAYPSEYIEAVRNSIRRERHRDSESEKFYMDEIVWFRIATSSPFSFVNSASFQGDKIYIDQIFKERKDKKLSKIVEISEQKIDERLLIFCEFINTVKYIEKELARQRNVYVITGDVILSERVSLFRRFRDDETGVLIMTSVGSEGLDLQFCSTIINYDLHWNPMILEQRIGRIDRIGQKKDKISIYNFMIEGSIDERILELLYKKIKIVEGSIFSPRDIVESTELENFIENKIENNKEEFENEMYEGSLKLYFPELFKEETKKAKKLLQMIEQNKDIKLKDYDFYEYIDKKYCVPELISSLGSSSKELPWTQTGEMIEWSLEIKKHSQTLTKILEDYNS